MMFEQVFLPLVVGLATNFLSDNIPEEFSGKIRRKLNRYLDKRKRNEEPSNADIEHAARKAGLLACLHLIQDARAVYLKGRTDNKGGYTSRFTRAEKYINEQLDLLEQDKWYEHLPEHVSIAFGNKDLEKAVNLYKKTLLNSDETDSNEIEKNSDDYDEALTSVYLSELGFGANWSAPNCWSSYENFINIVDAVFRDKKTGWPYRFRFNLAEELKDNTRFNRIATTLKLDNIKEAINDLSATQAIQQSVTDNLFQQIDSNILFMWQEMENVADKVDKLSVETKNQYEDLIKAILSNVPARQLAIDFKKYVRNLDPDFVPTIDNINDDRPVHYKNRADDFVGRDKQIEWVHETLIEPKYSVPTFKWMSVTGDAGVGKSRFALEFLKKYGRKNKWHYTGLLLSPTNKDEILNISLKGPALIIADYAGSIFLLKNLMAELAHRADTGRLYHDVRFLILERREDDQVFTRLTGVSGANPTAEHSLIRGSEVFVEKSNDHIKTKQRLHLTKIEDDFLYDLMKKRLYRKSSSGSSGPKPKQYSKEEILKELEYYDEDKRVLFAIITAEILRAGKSNANQSCLIDDTPENRRIQLAKIFLERERQSLNEFAKNEKISKSLQGKLKNLAFLATISQGFPIKMLLDGSLPNQIQAILPTYDEFSENEEYFARITLQTTLRKDSNSHKPNGNGKTGFSLAGVQPDFLGEWFVLEILENKGLDIEAMWMLVEFSWKINPNKYGNFVKICFDEFPETVRKLGLLSRQNTDPTIETSDTTSQQKTPNRQLQNGSDSNMDEAKARITFIADAAVSLLKKVGSEIPDLAQTKQAFSLLEQIDNGLLIVAQQDPNGHGAVLSIAVEQITNLIARTISPYAPRSIDAENRYVPKLQERKSNPIPEQQVEIANLALNDFVDSSELNLEFMLKLYELERSEISPIQIARIKKICIDKSSADMDAIKAKVMQSKIMMSEWPIDVRLDDLLFNLTKIGEDRIN